MTSHDSVGAGPARFFCCQYAAASSIPTLSGQRESHSASECLYASLWLAGLPCQVPGYPTNSQPVIRSFFAAHLQNQLPAAQQRRLLCMLPGLSQHSHSSSSTYSPTYCCHNNLTSHNCIAVSDVGVKLQSIFAPPLPLLSGTAAGYVVHQQPFSPAYVPLQTMAV